MMASVLFHWLRFAWLRLEEMSKGRHRLSNLECVERKIGVENGVESVNILEHRY